MEFDFKPFNVLQKHLIVMAVLLVLLAASGVYVQKLDQSVRFRVAELHKNIDSQISLAQTLSWQSKQAFNLDKLPNLLFQLNSLSNQQRLFLEKKRALDNSLDTLINVEKESIDEPVNLEEFISMVQDAFIDQKEVGSEIDQFAFVGLPNWLEVDRIAIEKWFVEKTDLYEFLTFLIFLLFVAAIVGYFIVFIRPVVRSIILQQTTLSEKYTHLEKASNIAGVGFFTWNINEYKLTTDARFDQLLAIENDVNHLDELKSKIVASQQAMLDFQIENITVQKHVVTMPLQVESTGRFVQLILGYFKNETISEIIGVAVDINDQKIRVDNLVEKIVEIEKGSKAKGEFLANMSYEIRTPLNAIIGMTQLFSSTSLNNEQKSYLDLMEGSANQLVGLLDDVLDLTKIENDELRLNENNFTLTKAIDGISNMLASSQRSSLVNIYFSIENDVLINLIGDDIRFTQVLVNLINNSIKYTQSGFILIRLKGGSIDDRFVQLLIDVEDSGIGMTEEEQRKLFVHYQPKQGAAASKYSATALGLSISKHIIEKMHGHISVHSDGKTGSVFSYDLKLGYQNKKCLLDVSKPKLDLNILLLSSDDKTNNIFENIAKKMVNMLVIKPELLENDNSFDWLVVDELSFEKNIDRIFLLRKMGVKIALIVNAFNRVEKSQFDDMIVVKPITSSKIIKMIQQFEKIPDEQALLQSDLVLENKTILLVEDNLVNKVLASKLLKNAGAQVLTAENGQQAIVVMEQEGEQIDAILMDVQMPIMDGYTSCVKIRNVLNYLNTPIIAMTANAMAGDREKCLDAGMNDYLTKPIRKETLYQTLDHWIGQDASLH